jgi:rhodanese-related sulfurtransferase
MKNVIEEVVPKNIGKMRIDADELIELLNENKVVFIDIRMAFETAVWGLNFGLRIPANELPLNLDKLPKDKLIVVSCPKTDRSIMARTYLASQGYDVRYLSCGLLGLMDRLKGGKAKDLNI